MDSNGDGIGDLAGIASRLDYLAWLGVDAVWLNPTFPSPNADWGYDVADYRDVHPELGSLADLDDLVAEAGRRGIRVLLDLVPNHTSNSHPWFEEARSSRSSPRRDWFVWADPKPDGSPPNNWLSAFGGSAWTRDERTGQCYLHLFLPEQPDLNWWSDDVRGEFEEILRFWLERGIAGFRIDVANALVNDRELRDDPPAAPDDPWAVKRGLSPVFSLNRPETHDVYRRWRSILNEYQPARVLVGEAWVRDLARWAAFSADDELHLAFGFRLLDERFEAGVMRAIMEQTYAVLPATGLPALAGSNHDVVRMTTRWCDGDERKLRCALLLLLTLRGVPVLYYGDEIGMPQVEVPPAARRDPVGRDGARTPMQWSAEPGCGFTTAVTSWLPFGDAAACNVAAQRDDPTSTLTFCRRLIAVRRALPELRAGGYATLAAPAGAWAWQRGETVSVAVNLSDAPVRLDGVRGAVALSTNHARGGETVAGSLELGGWEGAVVRAD